MTDSAAYPMWTTAELAERRMAAAERYVIRYIAEAGRAFSEEATARQADVRQLLAATGDLADIPEDFFAGKPALLRAARYAAAPSISEDTLKIVSAGLGIVPTLRASFDRDVFVWLDERGCLARSPMPDEIERSVHLTAKLIAEQTYRTAQRKRLAEQQERQVKFVLDSIGLRYIPRHDVIARIKTAGLAYSPQRGLEQRNLHEGLPAGSYSDELKLAGDKCDVPVRLASGGLLPIECKVSNTETNATKRLLRETGGKHRGWRSVFGDEVAVAAVLGGTFSLTNLETAQQMGMLLFFDHELDALAGFIAAGAVPRPRT